MQTGAVTQVRPVLSRVRLVDVPPGRVQGKHSREIASVLTNVQAGIGPMEALEIPTTYLTTSGGQYLAHKIRQALVKAKLDGVDVLVRQNEHDEVKIYVVGR